MEENMPEEWTIVRTRRRSKARSHQQPRSGTHVPSSFGPAISCSSTTPSAAAAAAAAASSCSSSGLHSLGNGTEKLVQKQDGEGEERRRRQEEEEEEQKLLVKVQRSMEKVQHSAFFKKFMEQLQDLELLETLLGAGDLVDETGSCLNGATSTRASSPAAAAEDLVDGVSTADSRECSNRKTKGIDVVVFGVGSIADSEVSRCQIALAMLLKQKFESFFFFNKILVYDPILSDLECRVLTSLGCAPMSIHDENGRRQQRAQVPTVFYMPHCEVSLYNNVLLANLEPPWCLGRVLVLGNSFHKYQERWSVFPQPKSPRPDCLLEFQKHVKEYIVDPVNFPLTSAFNDMSWHFFPHPPHENGILKLKPCVYPKT